MMVKSVWRMREYIILMQRSFAPLAESEDSKVKRVRSALVELRDALESYVPLAKGEK